MALLNKFFPGRRKQFTSSNSLPSEAQCHSQSIDVPFNSDQVRVLLFRECDFQGRKLLFDSSAIQLADIQQPSQPPPQYSYPATSKGVSGNRTTCLPSGKPSAGTQGINAGGSGLNIRKKYTYGRPQSDHNDLCEMVWGTAAMNFRGTSLKVHWLKKPSRILCSQIFLSPVPSAVHGKPPFNGSVTMSPPMNMSKLSVNGMDGTYSDISSLDTTSMSSFTGDSAIYSPTDGSRGSFQMDPMPNWSNGTDSGVNSDSPWNTSMSSFPRSSFGSFYSTDQDQRKTSIDSSIQGDTLLNGGLMGVMGTSQSGQQQHMQKRVLRCLSTSFENHNSLSDYIGVIGETTSNVPVGSGGSDASINKWRRNSEVIQNERLSNPEMARRKASGETISIPFYNHGRLHGNGGGSGGGGSTTGGGAVGNGNARRSKLGIAVCVTLNESFGSEMKVFFSEHICLFESLLNRLRAIVEGSYAKSQNVSHAMFRAWKVTMQHIQDLLVAPRITFPVWLTLSSAESNANNPTNGLADTFIGELCVLLSNADTKDTNFFISTLLTATLTHHLGWVGSVAPVNGRNTSDADALNEQREKRSEISKTHPYNALWAQMSDLFGAIGYPPKISRTIVVGKCHVTMDKILNVLTYFIRCGDIRKSGDACVLDKQKIDNVMDNMEEHLVDLDTTPFGSLRGADEDENEEDEEEMFRLTQQQERTGRQLSGNSGGGLYRTMSHMSSLNQLAGGGGIAENWGSILDNGVAMPIEALTSNKTPDMVRLLAKNVMNDIPKVFAYRDSRFIKQELRIGNHLMDTGMEMDQKVKREVVRSQQEIRVMVTSPENELIDELHHVEEEGVAATEDNDEEEEGGIEQGVDVKRNASVPINMMIPSRSLSALITENSLGSTKEATKLLWGVEPVKEGIGFDQWRHWERGVEMQEETRFMYLNRAGEGGAVMQKDVAEDELSLNEGGDENAFVRRGLFTKSGNQRKGDHHLLVRRSRMGRRRSGQNGMIELREEQEMAGGQLNGGQHNDVVFVLGDNDELVNLRLGGGPVGSSSSSSSMDVVAGSSSISKDLITREQRNIAAGVVGVSSTPIKPKQCCKHKTKHSGVKFNFEQYPQIAENYMRNKNFSMAGSEILAKAIKMEQEEVKSNEEAQLETLLRAPSSSSDEEEECECCAGLKANGLLQTPSNASELDLEWCNYDQSPEKRKVAVVVDEAKPGTSSSSMVMVNGMDRRGGGVANKRDQLVQLHQEMSGNVLQVVELPMPNVEEMREVKLKERSRSILEIQGPEEEEKRKRERNPLAIATKWGMVPSLMLGVTDHYVPDMVLQGIKLEAQNSTLQWEVNLKQDLILSARCATIEQIPTENVAVVANVDDWEVRIVSSSGTHFPQAAVMGEKEAGGCLVSYSASVVSMLETVHAMWSCGLPAYQCMSFIEAKLQEFYMQSEALAKFLMATEFCKLDDLTKALDVSANDIQLLLSVAATHSPQVTRKYGLSFR